MVGLSRRRDLLSTTKQTLPLLLIAWLAQAQAPQLIGPGQEELLSEMLGKGVALPGECKWDGATVQETRVVSWYLCAGARIELQLRHVSEADAGLAQTSQFTIRSAATPPAGLVEAVAQKVREREAAFVWSAPEVHTLPTSALPPEQQRTFSQWAAATSAALAFLLFIAAAFWWGRPTPGAITSTSPRWVWPVSLGFAAACLGTTRSLGRALWAGLERDGSTSLVESTLLMLLCAGLAIAAAALLSALPSPLPRWARLLVGPAAFVAMGLPLSLEPTPPPSLAGLGRKPNETQVETRRDRPKVTYRTGPFGFRQPEWRPHRAAGSRRIALVGDSYVFGIGVEEGDTISASLQSELVRRAPERAVEVINLGIPGANLTTHIDVAEAADELELDVLIVCLTLPNDLSRWDGMQARREAARVSPYSIGRFFLGQAADALWELANLDRFTTNAGLAHLDRELSRLAAHRQHTAHPPQLWFYSFRDLPTPVANRLAATPGAHVIPEGQTFEEDFLPIDGHPTPQGNRRTAGRLADALMPGGN